MKLFYTKGACSLATRIVINEIGIDCEYESVDLRTKRTESGEDYLKINPKGAVPALLIYDNEVLTENTVIQQYLADKNKAVNLLPAIGNLKRYRVLEWLNYISTELHKSFGSLFNPVIPQELKDKYLVPLLKAKFDFVNNQLKNKDYLYSSTFTLPDAYLFVMILWTYHFKFDLNAWPYIAHYFSGLQQRKSIKKSLEEEGLHTAKA